MFMAIILDGVRVTITGGAGFIGSNLAHELCQKNEVTVIDNLSTGSLENIKRLVDEHKIRFLNKSITELEALNDAFRNADYVLHQAAIPSVPRSVRDPLRTNETGGNWNLDGACGGEGLRR